MATSALTELGVDELTVDLGMPNLVPAILAASSLTEEALRTRLRLALDRKDVAAIDALTPALGRATSELLSTLVRISGPAEAALAALVGLDLPPGAAAERARLTAVHDGLRFGAPSLTLTIDAVESRVRVSHRRYLRHFRRGGRRRGRPGWPLPHRSGRVGDRSDVVHRCGDAALPRPELPYRVLLPAGTPTDVALVLRRKGWVTLRAFDAGVDAASEAARLGCSHILIDGQPQPVDPARTSRGGD